MPSIGGRSREPQAKRGGYGRVDVGAVGRGVRCPRLTWPSADGPPRKAASQAPTRIGDPCGVRTRDLHRDRVARTPLLQETKSVLQAGGRLPHPRPLVAVLPVRQRVQPSLEGHGLVRVQLDLRRQAGDLGGAGGLERSHSGRECVHVRSQCVGYGGVGILPVLTVYAGSPIGTSRTLLTLSSGLALRPSLTLDALLSLRTLFASVPLVALLPGVALEHALDGVAHGLDQRRYLLHRDSGLAALHLHLVLIVPTAHRATSRTASKRAGMRRLAPQASTPARVIPVHYGGRGSFRERAGGATPSPAPPAR